MIRPDRITYELRSTSLVHRFLCGGFRVTFTYPWPIPPNGRVAPVWTGKGFQLGGAAQRLLSYAVGASGWTNDLTSFHEQTAGEDHFIDRASRRHALGQVKRHARKPGAVVLEVGCSSGYLLQDLRTELPGALVMGADFVRGPLDALGQRVPDVPLLQFDLVRCPLPSSSIDVAVLLNVLEHIEDHEAALGQVARILQPGGVAVLEVPAGPHLYDVYDRVLMHHRRYTLSGLSRLVERAGLHVIFASHLGTLLYPGFSYVKRKNRRHLTASEEEQKQIVGTAIRQTGRNRLLEGVMAFEDRLRSLVPLPFGIRCLMTCMKPALAPAPNLRAA